MTQEEKQLLLKDLCARLPKEREELEPWDKIGPTVKEFLYGRPERKFKVGDSIRHISGTDGVEKAVVKEISETSYYCETPRGTATIPFSAEDGYELDIKPMWSDEEETIIDCAVEVVEKAGLPSLAASLKSLRPCLSDEEIKKIRSEEYTKGFNDAAFGGKAWKPSKEQMAVLKNAMCFYGKTIGKEVLESLYNDLQKL